jgi:hypothetical protein
MSGAMSRLVGAIYFLCAVSTLLVVAGGLTGCGPMLFAQSAPPPGRVARLDSVDGFWGVKSYRMEISVGVALAVTCHQGGPCEKLQVRSEDPKKVEAHTASLNTLERTGYSGNQAPSSGVVLVGKSPGTAKLFVKTKRGSREIAVTVVAPPDPSPAARVAR